MMQHKYLKSPLLLNPPFSKFSNSEQNKWSQGVAVPWPFINIAQVEAARPGIFLHDMSKISKKYYTATRPFVGIRWYFDPIK